MINYKLTHRRYLGHDKKIPNPNLRVHVFIGNSEYVRGLNDHSSLPLHKIPEDNFFIEIKKNKLVIATVLLKPNWTKDPKCLDLWSLRVKRKYRGKGYAKLVCNLAKEYARLHGFDHIWLNVYTSNHAAFNLYKSLGYEVVSTGMQSGKPTYNMVLTLTPKDRQWLNNG